MGEGTRAGTQGGDEVIMKEFQDVIDHAGDMLWVMELPSTDITKAVGIVEGCLDRVVVTGIGKAGIVARKISATLSSTGTPSFFVHPTEAFHGDLGMIGSEDVLLVLSNSGTTSEITRLLPHIKKVGCAIVSITGDKESELAKMSDACLCYGDVREAGELGLAPTTSTTIMMVIGDALAMAAASSRNLTAEEYARYHPGGALGGKAVTAKMVMREVARFRPENPVDDVAYRLACRHDGLGVVEDAQGKARGVVTIALCLRRSGQHYDWATESAMTPIANAVVAKPDTTVAELMAQMRKHRVNQIPVIEDGKAIGVVDVQDIVGLRLDSTV